MEISRLTRDGTTAEPVSRDKFSGVNGDREILTRMTGPDYAVMSNLINIHVCIHT